MSLRFFILLTKVIEEDPKTPQTREGSGNLRVPAGNVVSRGDNVRVDMYPVPERRELASVRGVYLCDNGLRAISRYLEVPSCRVRWEFLLKLTLGVKVGRV